MQNKLINPLKANAKRKTVPVQPLRQKSKIFATSPCTGEALAGLSNNNLHRVTIPSAPNGVTTIASHRNAFAAGHAGKQQFICLLRQADQHFEKIKKGG